MIKNITSHTEHLLLRKELPYSIEFLSYHKFEAEETKVFTHLGNFVYVTFEKSFGDLSVIITYSFNLNTSEDLFEKSVELKINDEYTSLDFQNKLDLYNLVYALEKGITKQIEA